jgi:hypothetical protein
VKLSVLRRGLLDLDHFDFAFLQINSGVKVVLKGKENKRKINKKTKKQKTENKTEMKKK